MKVTCTHRRPTEDALQMSDRFSKCHCIYVIKSFCCCWSMSWLVPCECCMALRDQVLSYMTGTGTLSNWVSFAGWDLRPVFGPVLGYLYIFVQILDMTSTLCFGPKFGFGSWLYSIWSHILETTVSCFWEGTRNDINIELFIFKSTLFKFLNGSDSEWVIWANYLVSNSANHLVQ